MYTVLALLDLGCTSSVNGDDPISAEEYLEPERVTIHSGKRPKWDEVVARIEALKLADTIKRFSKAVQSHIDATAKQRNYDDGASIASYASSSIPDWAAEALVFVAWRDEVWAYAYTELAKVEKAERSIPSISELIDDLPKITWPK